MANYNTFLVISTKGKPALVTSSARKAGRILKTGARVEVWSANQKTETIYYRCRSKLDKYINLEREYIKAKQAAAERRNQRRRRRGN